ncbi:hypothetical protein J6590_055239 [Homalodisca vitripennis]|nr:hypothetical protein J6590_055239 [Homalodisca vitripennis]
MFLSCLYPVYTVTAFLLVLFLLFITSVCCSIINKCISFVIRTRSGTAIPASMGLSNCHQHMVRHRAESLQHNFLLLAHFTLPYIVGQRESLFLLQWGYRIFIKMWSGIGLSRYQHNLLLSSHFTVTYNVGQRERERACSCFNRVTGLLSVCVKDLG